MATVILIVASRLIAVVDGRDPGFDQAMLMSSFPLDTFSAYFLPLPFFEQATALGSVFELDLLSRIFGTDGINRFVAIRLIAGSVACLGYYVLYRVMKRSFSTLEIALVLILIASPRETLLFTTNPKNYVNAFLASCLLIRAAQIYLDRPGRQQAVIFLTATVFACFFSFTAPLMLAATGGGMLVATLSRHRVSDWVSQRVMREILGLVFLGALSALLCAVFYFFFTKVVTALDQAAYADRYANTFLDVGHLFSEHNVNSLQNVLRVLYLMVSPAALDPSLFRLGMPFHYLPVLHVLFAIIALVGFPAFWRRSILLAGGLVAGMACFLTLNAIHILPIASTRHFMFFAPFAVPCFAFGIITTVRAILGLVRQPWLIAHITAICVLGIGTTSAIVSARLENTEVSGHLEQIGSFPAPLWLYYGTQPSIRALHPDLLEGESINVIGLLPHASTTTSWTVNARGTGNNSTSDTYVANAAANLTGQEPVWLLLAHYWPETGVIGGLDRYFAAAEVDGRQCRKVFDEGSILALCTMPDAFPEKLSSTFN